MLETTDTIVALCSPAGRSWRGLVRLSGGKVRPILGSVLDQSSIRGVESHRMSKGRLIKPSLPVLLLFYGAPASYTGQDVAEIQLPGNPVLLDLLIRQLIEAGCRLAEPGEFTFRAFTSGKLDLIQAEGIAATIGARSDGQLKAASLLRDGKLGSMARHLVDELGTQLALVEAGIDFVDQEDVVPIEPGILDQKLSNLAQQITGLLSRCRAWGTLEALPRVVLVGPPSVGKSTLFNALLGRRRAVISALPGTTRDELAEPLKLDTPSGDCLEVMLVDIAGLDEPAVALDRQMQAAARRAIEQADLLLRLVESTCSVEWSSLMDCSDGPPMLSVQTKSDLVHQASAPGEDLQVSALTSHNLDKLKNAIVKHIGNRGVSVNAEMLALQPRHEAALRSALAHLEKTRQLLACQRNDQVIDQVELVAATLRRSLDDLAALGGQLTPDDVIGKVFGTFCIGK